MQSRIFVEERFEFQSSGNEKKTWNYCEKHYKDYKNLYIMMYLRKVRFLFKMLPALKNPASRPETKCVERLYKVTELSWYFIPEALNQDKIVFFVTSHTYLVHMLKHTHFGFPMR